LTKPHRLLSRALPGDNGFPRSTWGARRGGYLAKIRKVVLPPFQQATAQGSFDQSSVVPAKFLPQFCETGFRYPNLFSWVLTKPRRISPPIKAKGQLGLFGVSLAVERIGKLLSAVATKWIGVVTLVVVPEDSRGDCTDTAVTVACALQQPQMNSAQVRKTLRQAAFERPRRR